LTLLSNFLSDRSKNPPLNSKNSLPVKCLYRYVFSGINHIFAFDCNVSPVSQKTLISPDSGSINPIIHFIVVVFHAPFGPRNQYISPDFTEKDTSFKIFFFAKYFTIFFTSKIAIELVNYINNIIHMIF